MTQTQQLVSIPLISPDTEHSAMRENARIHLDERLIVWRRHVTAMGEMSREIARMQAMNRKSLVVKQVDDAASLA